MEIPHRDFGLGIDFDTVGKNILDKTNLCKNNFLIKKGKVIFQEGQFISGIYLIREGICKMTKFSGNGKSQIIRFLKTNDILGHRSIINQEPTNLTATALTNLKVCFISKEEVMEAFAADVNFSMAVVRSLSNELRRSDNFIVDMAQKSVRQRLADTILYMHSIFGEDVNGFIDIDLSREDISNIVGTATESLIRNLSTFSKEGFIATKSKRIKIISEGSLKKISDLN